MYFNSSTALAMTLNKLGWVPTCVGTVSLYVYYAACNFAVMPIKNVVLGIAQVASDCA